MSKLEANVSLFIITFFGVVQLVFLARVPGSVSYFAFLCVTNLIGFLMSLAFFFQELSRLDFSQVKQSMVLSTELVVFNIFLLLGVPGTGPAMADALLSTDFVFISIIAFLLHRQIPDRGSRYGIALVLLGLFFMTDANITELLNWNVLYLIVSEIAFAVYIITTGRYSASSNPAIIAMGQMFFCFVFSLVLWVGEAFLYGAPLSLPASAEFWGSVIYVSFFIRGLYGIVQVYAQKYVTPLNTSLIFATEIVMAMAVSLLLTRLFGTEPERITWLRAVGGVLIMAGVLLSEGLTGSTGGAANKKAVRRSPKRYWLYTLPLAAFFGGAGCLLEGPQMAGLYGLLGFLAGILVTVLLEGVLCLIPLPDDAVFCLEAGGQSLEDANEILETTARKCFLPFKRVMEVQSCIEEISIRIFGVLPDTKINTRIRFGEAVSVWLSCSGRKYNPLRIEKGEDELDSAGLKIIRHRALRASFGYRNGENRIHVVV
ncbi:MAG: DMT family transporter [Fretibacterium sp.]|nr:DMT family transporter [Fretibacterium sp.]